MRPSVLAAASAAITVSVFLHATGFIALVPTPVQTLAGGPTQLAMIGNNFEDTVAGSVTGDTAPVPAETVPVSPLATPVPTSSQTQTVVSPTKAQVVPATTVATQNQPVTTLPVLPDATAVRPAGTATAAELAQTTVASRAQNAAPEIVRTDSVVSAQPVVVTATSTVTAIAPASTSTVSPDRIVARVAPVVRTPTADTVRPRPRPKQRAQPIQRRTKATQPRAQSTQQAARRGNAEETTRKGQNDGQTAGRATQTRQGNAGQATSNGREAARYPQRVNRHLSRARRPSTRFNGAAVVAFTVGVSGGVATVSIARSSGNAEFDQMAMAHIRRAAPFPAPPPDAQRRFSVSVRGR